MSEDQRIGFVRGIRSLEHLVSMTNNVIERKGWSDRLAEAFKQRELELFEQKATDRLQRLPDALAPIKRKIVRDLAALRMTQEDHSPPNRSFQAIRNRNGDLIKFADEVVLSRLESHGYRRLKAAGYDNLVLERMVLDHPEAFSEKTRFKALTRLNQFDAIVAAGPISIIGARRSRRSRRGNIAVPISYSGTKGRMTPMSSAIRSCDSIG